MSEKNLVLLFSAPSQKAVADSSKTLKALSSPGWTNPSLSLFSHIMCSSPWPSWWPIHWLAPVCQCLSCRERKATQTAQDVNSLVPNGRERSVPLTCWLHCCLHSPVCCYPPLGKGTLLVCTRVVVYQDSEVFFSSAPQPVGPQPVLVQGVIPSLMQDAVCVFVELSRVSVSPLLQSVQTPLSDSGPQFGITPQTCWGCTPPHHHGH